MMLSYNDHLRLEQKMRALKCAGQPFATVVAAPTARLDRSREVLLVWTLPQTLLEEALTVTEPAEEGRGQ